MSKLDILKGGIELLVSIGVGAIVGNAIKITADNDATKFKKVAIGVGAFVLSSMVTDAAVKYTNTRIDEAAATIQKFCKPKAKDVEIAEDISSEADESEEVAVTTLSIQKIMFELAEFAGEGEEVISRGEGEEVISRMKHLIKTYGFATVSDLYDMIGLSPSSKHDNFGWFNFDEASVTKDNAGHFVLNLPSLSKK